MSVATVFGIDLGTTKSVSGIVMNGRVELVPNEHGKHTVPSYVAYPPNGRPVFAVGNIARGRMRFNAAGVIYDCKRLIGMNYDDPIVKKMKKYVAFELLGDGNNKPQICVKQGYKVIKKYPEEIEASILQEMQKMTAEYVGFDIRKVVITVPAYFNQFQRQATKDAGKIAGLDVVGVISEPVAAAYAYADQNNVSVDNKERIVMIYDLGGTFNVTIMSIMGSKYRELGSDGDPFLGGIDFDTLLMKEVKEAFETETGDELTSIQLSKLRYRCEEAKIALKSLPEADIEINDDICYTLTRAKMDSLLKPMIQRSIDICDKLLVSCKKTKDDIDDIILVGGSSHLGLVHSMLENHYHKELIESIDPDECVAYGAAKYGYLLSKGGENDNQQIEMKSVDEISENENRDEWRRNWKECLRGICDQHNDGDVDHMLEMNVERGNVRGVLKRGDEVIEVRNENENEVELMIVNVKNHSMRVLRGSEGEELVEMDLSELKENEIIDLNDEGRRWEGGVLKGEVFGYGCLYDEENRLEYEGWMIDGVKRCYGIEYWNDLGIVKYDGCYYNGMKHGYGLLYDRRGDIEYDELFTMIVVWILIEGLIGMIIMTYVFILILLLLLMISILISPLSY